MSRIIDATDKGAIVLSILCIMHCIALPIMLFLLPSVAALVFLENEYFHLFLVFAVIPVSIYALVYGYKQHEDLRVVILSTCGILTLLAAVIFGHDLMAGKGEVVLTLIGSSLVALSHVGNLRLRRKVTALD